MPPAGGRKRRGRGVGRENTAVKADGRDGVAVIDGKPEVVPRLFIT